MIRTGTIALAIATLAGAASAQPLALNNAQLDRVSAGGLSLSVLIAALTSVPSSVTLPEPLSAPLTVSQAADVTISVNATVRPAEISITHPGH